MNKKTIIKYTYFTILLLLPYAPAILSQNLLPVLNVRWILLGTPTNFGDIIIYLFLMSINFIVAFKLHEIHKRKSIARITFLILLAYIVIIFLAEVSGAGDGMMVLFIPLGLIIPYNPLYFFGILIYDRFINKEHKLEDSNTDK